MRYVIDHVTLLKKLLEKKNFWKWIAIEKKTIISEPQLKAIIRFQNLKVTLW